MCGIFLKGKEGLKLFGWEGIYIQRMWIFMVKAEFCRTLKIDPNQREIIEDVIRTNYSSVESFGMSFSEKGEETKHYNSYMYRENLEKYLSGKIPLSVRPARAMLKALGSDSRLGFLEEIAQQKLRTD